MKTGPLYTNKNTVHAQDSMRIHTRENSNERQQFAFFGNVCTSE